MKNAIGGLFGLALCLCGLGVPSEASAWHSLLTGGKCKQSGGSCRTTIGNAGGANACCDPRSSGLATCATNNECQGNTPYKWASLPLGWSLNLNNMPGKNGYAGKTGPAIEAALKQAWDAWTKPTCTGFQHKYQGQSSTRPSTSDRKLVCFLASPNDWAGLRLPSSVLAVTRPAAGSNGHLRDADIIFNPTPSRRVWGIHPNVKSNEMDFADVAAHEIGHALGFGHTAPRSSLMYYSVRGVGALFQGLTSDEESGVCTIYPVQKCNDDGQCGTCRACTNGTCGPKNLAVLPAVCKACQSDANCAATSCVDVGGRKRCLQPCDPAGCCANGYTCKTLSGKKLCVPDSEQCPDATCTQNSDCGAGETCQAGVCKKSCQRDADCGAGLVCKNSACVKAEPAKLGQPCSANIPCVSGTTCQSTSKGSICTVACGSGTGGFPNGSPGSACSSCASGTQCVTVVSSIRACLRQCSSSSQCRSSGGGLCGRINNGTPICICRGDSDCSSGYSCNKAVLGRLNVGACAKRGGGTCPTGYTCKGNYCEPAGTGNTCGNGQCDGSETCTSCPKDCPCPSGQTCLSGQCQAPAGCGNGTCESPENCNSCAQDCPCPADQACLADGTCQAPKAICGNGTCDGAENCNSCATDCGCPEGLSCRENQCKPLTTCGNGTCDPKEACDNCPQDCGCPSHQVCLNSSCQGGAGDGGSTGDGGSPPPLPDAGQKVQGSIGGPCRTDGTCQAPAFCFQQGNGQSICLVPKQQPPTGCGCHSLQSSLPLSAVLLALLLLGALRREQP